MKQTLLIIDDESSIIESLTRALSGVGCDILSATDPKAGLEIMKTSVPQVVITDLKMPGMDGLQVLHHVKEFNPHIQVIVITGHGSIDDAVASMKKGAYDFIPKPFNKQEILAVVNRAFEKVSLLQENFLLREKLKPRAAMPPFSYLANQARAKRSLPSTSSPIPCGLCNLSSP
jgi:DNA-binding NtrC family response regulator